MLRRTLVAWVAAVGALIIAAPSVLAGTMSETFKFGDDKPRTWTVPDDVTEVTVEVAGGGGGATRTDRGGHGALVVVEVEVTPGETFSIGIGGGGGGGGSNQFGGGGGGASIVQGPDLGADRVADRLLVIAGGGGGAGVSSQDRRGGDAGRNNSGAGEKGRGDPRAGNGAPGNGAGATNDKVHENTGDGLAFDPSITFDPDNPTDNGAGGGRSKDSNPNRALVGGAGSSGGSRDRGGLGGAGYGGGAAAPASTATSFAGGAGGSIGQGAGVTSVTYSPNGGQGGTTDNRRGNAGWVTITWVIPVPPAPPSPPDPPGPPGPPTPDQKPGTPRAITEPVIMNFTVPAGLTCTGPRLDRTGAWVQVPAERDCAIAPSARSIPGAGLLGWATTPDFPVNIAQRQVDNGWDAYELTNNNDELTAVFIPAGGWTQASSDTNLFPIWATN